MQEIKNLVERFLSGTMSAIDFRLAYLDLWRELGDEMVAAEDRHPDLKAKRETLLKQWEQGLIDKPTLEQQYQALAAQMYEGCRIQLFTKECELVDNLFTATERYDLPEIRDELPDLIGEAELVEEVRQAMHQFEANSE